MSNTQPLDDDVYEVIDRVGDLSFYYTVDINKSDPERETKPAPERPHLCINTKVPKPPIDTFSGTSELSFDDSKETQKTILEATATKTIMIPPDLPHPKIMDSKKCKVHYKRIETVVKSMNLQQPYAYGFIISNILPQHESIFEDFLDEMYESDGVDWECYKCVLDHLYICIDEAEKMKRDAFREMDMEMETEYGMDNPLQCLEQHLGNIEYVAASQEPYLADTWIEDVKDYVLDYIIQAADDRNLVLNEVYSKGVDEVLNYGTHDPGATLTGFIDVVMRVFESIVRFEELLESRTYKTPLDEIFPKGPESSMMPLGGWEETF